MQPQVSAGLWAGQDDLVDIGVGVGGGIGNILGVGDSVREYRLARGH